MLPACRDSELFAICVSGEWCGWNQATGLRGPMQAHRGKFPTFLEQWHFSRPMLLEEQDEPFLLFALSSGDAPFIGLPPAAGAPG